MPIKLCRDPWDRQQDEPVAVCVICREDIYEADKIWRDSAGNVVCNSDYCLADWARRNMEELNGYDLIRD